MRNYIFILFLVLFTSCQQQETIINLSGTYSGEFTVQYTNGTNSKGNTSLVLNDDYTYYSEGNSDRIPSGGRGSYFVTGNKIHFTDSSFWTADFDWGLILNHEYQFKLSGRNLDIWRQNDLASYKYSLKRN